MVHRSGGCHRAGVEGLHLVGAETTFFQPDGQIHHVVVAGAGVGCDEVRNQKLLFAGFERVLFKHLLELVVAADARLHHFGQRALLGVLGRNLQIAADVVRHQFLDVFRALNRKVVAQAGADQNLFHTLKSPRAAVHLDQGVMVCIEIRANAGVDATRLATSGFDFG